MLDYMATLQKNYRVFYKKSTFESIQPERVDTLVFMLEVNVTLVMCYFKLMPPAPW